MQIKNCISLSKERNENNETNEGKTFHFAQIKEMTFDKLLEIDDNRRL